jgi:hypothetical protein
VNDPTFETQHQLETWWHHKMFRRAVELACNPHSTFQVDEDRRIKRVLAAHAHLLKDQPDAR